MSKISLASTLAIVSLLTAPPALACDGSACKDIELTYKNQCNIVTNKGDKTVYVTWGRKDWAIPAGGSVKVTADLNGVQTCLGTVTGKVSATYEK
jgi:hypothetical protein